MASTGGAVKADAADRGRHGRAGAASCPARLAGGADLMGDPALACGRRKLSVWLPGDWEVVGGQMEEPYRANLSIAHITLDAGPASLEEVEVHATSAAPAYLR